MLDYEVDYFESSVIPIGAERPKRVLILGSSGQVGAYLTEYLRKEGYEVFEFDVVCVIIDNNYVNFTLLLITTEWLSPS